MAWDGGFSRRPMPSCHLSMMSCQKSKHLRHKTAEYFNHLKHGSVQCTNNCYFFVNSPN